MLGTKRLVELCHRMLSLDVSTFNTNKNTFRKKEISTLIRFVDTHSKALVHVSTAYCNCDRTEINEVIYSTPYDPANIINLINWLPEDVLDKVCLKNCGLFCMIFRCGFITDLYFPQLTPSLIGKRPNTYTFTKALTEQMLLEEAGNLPVAIVRPSIGKH